MKKKLAFDPYSSRWFAANMIEFRDGKDFAYERGLLQSLEEFFTVGEMPKRYRDDYEKIARKVGGIPYPSDHWTNDG